jgi:lysyl-tRNA synthetase class 1
MVKEREIKFWADAIAEKIIEREEKLKRDLKVLRTESGLGASGFPHIGSFGDVVRNYVVSLALKDLGFKSELISYSDDRDGLRKVPLTLPNWLEKHIGMPVTDIPDPFKCHESFGEHMRSLLLEALDKAGIEYKHHSAQEDYKKGVFNEQIEKILLNADKVGKIIEKLLGQKKFVKMLPFFPVCENCGKIYTTRAYELLPKEHKVLYICDQEFTGKNLNTGKIILVKGCGHKGEASYFNTNGKMSWKAEFAMRWAALKIVFEAYGKDIADSVKVNDEVSRKILGFEPPLHLMYEMFLDKSGKKISKSFGNVFTPQVWFKYGSIPSLNLLLVKRFMGTRELDVTDVPKYMDELNRLEKIYLGLEKVPNKRDEIHLKRLFEYAHLFKYKKKTPVFINYSTFVELAKILPEKNQVEFAINQLRKLGLIKEVNEDVRKTIEERLNFAKNWIEDFLREEVKVELTETEKKAVEKLIAEIEKEEDGEKLQARIFEIAREEGIEPPRFFKILYRIILKSDRGPRLGPYIIERGKDEIIEKLKASIG